LNGCPPTLKALSTAEVNNDIPPNYLRRFESLVKLYLGVNEIANEVADFVSDVFPNLHNLSICGKVKGDLPIALRNSNFQAAGFQIHKDRPSRNLRYSFSFKLSNTNETTFSNYNFIRGDPCHSTFQVDHAAIVDSPLLSIECFTEMQTGMPPHGQSQPMEEPCTCMFRLSKYAM
jgi:hypothetical protein